MTAPVPPVDLDQLETALAATTPGPWACNDEPETYVAREGRVWATQMPDGFDDEVAETVMHADAAAIVAAVNAAPQMAAELRAIRAERDTLRRQLAVAREVYRTTASLDGCS